MCTYINKEFKKSHLRGVDVNFSTLLIIEIPRKLSEILNDDRKVCVWFGGNVSTL